MQSHFVICAKVVQSTDIPIEVMCTYDLQQAHRSLSMRKGGFLGVGIKFEDRINFRPPELNRLCTCGMHEAGAVRPMH